MDDETRKRFDQLEGSFSSLFGRLMGKVDRMGINLDQLSVLSRAGEEAMTSLDALARRVAKLEAAKRDPN